MEISPDQAALYAQVAPVFMLVAIAERYAIVRVFSHLPRWLQPAVGPTLVALMLAFAIVAVYGISAADTGLQGTSAIIARLLFNFGMCAIVYIFTLVIYAEAKRGNNA